MDNIKIGDKYQLRDNGPVYGVVSIKRSVVVIETKKYNYREYPITEVKLDSTWIKIDKFHELYKPYKKGDKIGN